MQVEVIEAILTETKRQKNHQDLCDVRLINFNGPSVSSSIF